MKDDPNFNINFVGLVENKPCIYDFTRSEYSNKNIQDQAWAKIADQLSEPVEDCKERWKNLRGCYTRHLKSLRGPSRSGTKTKKPYYLTEYLRFLQPFTKSRKPKGNICSAQYRTEAEDAQLEEVDNSDEQEHAKDLHGDVSRSTASEHHEGNSLRTPDSKKPKKEDNFFTSIAEANRSAFQYFETKNDELKSDDPDLAFLRSVLPDMKEMSSDQKRRFKVGILHLAGQILSED